MTTLNARGSSVVSTNGSTWASTANAIDGVFGANNNTYATYTSIVDSATGYIEIGGYNFSTIPANAVLTSFTVALRAMVSNSSMSPVGFQCYNGATAVGSAYGPPLTSAIATYSQVVPLTLAQVKTVNRVRVDTAHKTTTLAVLSIDWIDVSAVYTLPPVTSFSASAASVMKGGSVTFTDTSTGDAATSWAWNFGAGATPASATTKGPHVVTYATPGTSTVTHSATNAAGTTAATNKTVTVNNPKTETLTDSFDTTLDKVIKWPDTSAETVWESGRVRIPVTPSYYGLATTAGGGYSLVGSYVFAQMTPPPLGNGGRETYLEVYRAGTTNYSLSLLIGGTSLLPRKVVNGAATYGTAATYDATTHAWWRIRESAGTIYYDYSADGLAWSNLWSTTSDWDVSNVYINIVSGYWGTESAADAYVDNVNVVSVVTTTGRPKVWTGTAWVKKPEKVWTGVAWVEKPVKVWTGSTWKAVT